MDELTQAWLEEEALHGDEELIVIPRCEWAGHQECKGPLYKLPGPDLISCYRHLVLHERWCAIPVLHKDFIDWLDDWE